jgi:ribosome-associated translation inhibitor RaiA
MMRIEIRDAYVFGTQTHAYAEYRAFASLAPLGNVAQRVTVALAAADRRGADPVTGVRVVCTITVMTGPGQEVEVRARGRHPYEAIDRAARRMRNVLIQRTSTGAKRESARQLTPRHETA